MTDDEGREPEHRDEGTLDRELSELVDELRTIIPGVTLLFAFLLTVPFSPAFRPWTAPSEAPTSSRSWPPPSR